MSEAKRKYTAQHLRNMIAARYNSDREAYATFYEVPNGTGHHKSRAIDAVVQSLWPSNGLWRAAFEIKVSRADFLKECADFTKSAWVRKQFHYFWFVAPADVIQDGEVPEEAGWLCPRGDGLTIKKQAPSRDAPDMPVEMFAGLCRAAHQWARAGRTQDDYTTWQMNPDTKKLQAIQDGVDLFLKPRGKYRHDCKTPGDIKALLEECTDHSDLRAEEYRQVNAVLSQFQSNVVNLLYDVAAISHIGLLERDEAGEFINQVYSQERRRQTIKVRAKLGDLDKQENPRAFLKQIIESGGFQKWAADRAGQPYDPTVDHVPETYDFRRVKKTLKVARNGVTDLAAQTPATPDGADNG